MLLSRTVRRNIRWTFRSNGYSFAVSLLIIRVFFAHICASFLRLTTETLAYSSVILRALVYPEAACAFFHKLALVLPSDKLIYLRNNLQPYRSTSSEGYRANRFLRQV